MTNSHWPVCRSLLTDARRQRLLAWAAPLGEERTWAIESAGGLGKLLAQQLLSAVEHAYHVPPTLSARVRLLGSTKAGKNDGNDASATAIAGLRHCGLRTVPVEDHTAVIRLRIDRYQDLVALRTQAACRFTVALRELVPGGAPRRLSADRAANLLGRASTGPRRLNANVSPVSSSPMSAAWIVRSPPPGRRVTDAVTASGTALLEVHGIGAIVAGFILGHVGDPARFTTPDRFAAYNGTAPIEASSGPKQTPPVQPPREPAAQPRAAPRRRHPGRARHPGTGLLRPQARRGQDEEGSAAGVEASDQRRRLAPPPSRPSPPLTPRAREDNQGRLFNPAWPAEP